MENILNKIGELSGSLGDFRSEVMKIINEITKVREQQGLVKIEQDTRKKDLDAREEEIKKVEDLVKLKSDTEGLLEKLNISSSALQKSQQKLTDDIAKHNAQVADDNAKNDKVRNSNEAESKALLKTRTELEEEKKTYKEKLLKELLSKVK
jgi:hypothetical protein